MLSRARWAQRRFGRYDHPSVVRIVDAVAAAGAKRAAQYADWAVRETGFGVVAHKEVKNRICSQGIADYYRSHDYVSPIVDAERGIVEIPRPAGVVLALTPSTNPVATVYFKILLSLMTRNAVVVSPHPMARDCCVDAALHLAEVAVSAGAPDGAIQAVEEPSVPLIEALMSDEYTDVILATGGSAVVRAAYRSGTPSIGVGPGNVPVLVDRTADIEDAATKIVDSKSFDNSVLCTNESVLIADDAVAASLLRAMRAAGAHVLEGEDMRRLAAVLFPQGQFDASFIGKSASEIAAAADIRVAGATRILLAPFELVVDEEPFAHEKLCPVLGMVRVPDAARGIRAARSVLRIGGPGHSAAIHTTDAATALEFGASVGVLRIAVNEGSSTGSAGIGTGLATSMTIGTGFVGQSSMGENLEPKHLINHTRLAYGLDALHSMPSFAELTPWTAPTAPVPGYPYASNERQPSSDPPAQPPDQLSGEMARFRDELRRLILDELTSFVRT